MSNLRWTIRWHLKQRRPRPARRRGDLVSFAAGVAAGAGLCLIWINLYVEMWPR